MQFLQFEIPQKLQWEFCKSLSFVQGAAHVLHPSVVLWYSWLFFGFIMKKIASFSSNSNSREPIQNFLLPSSKWSTLESPVDLYDYVSGLFFLFEPFSWMSIATLFVKAVSKSISLLTNLARLSTDCCYFLLPPNTPTNLIVRANGRLNTYYGH